MRKEILIAVLAGIMVGLIVAFGAWRANSAFKVKNTVSDTPRETTNTTSETPKNEDKLAITLVNFEDYDIITESPFKISGATSPESIVVISGEDEDYTIKSNKDGSFEQEINLVGGVNQILFSVLNSKGLTIEKKVIVVYSSEFAKSI